ncbi:WD40 repeat domain-containing protein [Actinoplanes derwentensis]|uniref:PQQ-like domain-containing protein n=1 Tax=Actinoplanes derwentensis TaxID=113562 RepID=A0A1H2BAS0_9ACTN|nr:PQQ-binding-like beta-propeller repeat protein [Actinoplanes derwentensis]GID86484.1 hypothetical protein Ade03nite_54080 [Actinoplanes derwentensis]SDT54989.1 hypothetical protein SAMN04489716_4453 [Actinoplanes derwentensis]
MIVTDRLIRILHVPGHGLLASDIYGRIHLLDADDLTVRRSSPFVRQGRPVYGLAVADGWVIGKDRMGAILRWRLDTLELAGRLDPATVCDPSGLLPGEEPSPVSSRGIGIWNGRVHVSSGYHRQMLVVDLHTFEVAEVRPNICGTSPMEWACTEHPDRHAVSDKKGNLRFGSFATGEFPRAVKLDDGNIHRVRYDARHDRFWATQDFGAGATADVANGVVIVSPDGEKLDELLFARDDVEFVTFTKDHSRAYSGGFDGELHIFDNSGPELRIDRTITGFSHQLTDCTVAEDGTVYVLCQDGEVTALDPDGVPKRSMGFARQAIWDVQSADGERVFLATDTGVAVARVVEDTVGPLLAVEAEHETGFGFTRRIAVLSGGVAGITRDHRVFRLDATGRMRWSSGLPALPHTVVVSPDGERVLVATNAGAIEVSATDGQEIRRYAVDGLPIWAGVYLPSGEVTLITRNGILVVLAVDGTETWRFEQGEYPKRAWVQDGRLYVVGDGGLKEIVIGQGVVCRWSRLLSNTVENAVVCDGMVYAGSYGMQVAAYEHESSRFAGLMEDLPDYPKALAVVRDSAGTPFLLVGCRGGLLSTYRVGAPKVFAKVRDQWLARRPARTLLTETVRPKEAVCV